MSDSLLSDLLSVPTAPTKKDMREENVSKKIEFSSDRVDVTLNDEVGVITEGTAFDYLEGEGLIPGDWEIQSFRKSQWGDLENPKESVSFTFKPRAGVAESERLGLDVDGMLARLESEPPRPSYLDYEETDAGFVVALGDMQFGKADGDGPEGALRRTIQCIDAAAEQFEREREFAHIDHIHVAWLGDHIEGFQSQGGANAWRTVLTLTEQIRLTRRVMMHALATFAPLVGRVTMAAVPGNHGETVRFEGKGITRYDDSHDTESLVAVADAAAFNPDAFGHVEFYVPDSDEMTVTLDVANTTISHVHGHQWRPGKQFEWWQGQSFNRDSPLGNADVLLAGHLHHAHIEEDTDRLYIGVPALEGESTWYRHSKGTGGSPGILTAVVVDGSVSSIKFVR